MVSKRLWLIAAVVVLLLAAASPALAAPQGPVAPILGADSPTAIPGRYIVVFRPGTPGAAANASAASALAMGAQVHYTYDAALQGFAATMPEQALNGLRHNPNVEYIEVDSTVSLDATQTGATWGLDRIDQAALPLNGTYNYNYTGAGVKAYIIDTGIRVTHNEFGGRASYGYDAVDKRLPAADCHGHGTHVAGTVGGATYGVAKGVSLVAVRVLNCAGSGTTSGVIKGIDWVTSDHHQGPRLWPT